MHSLSCNSVPKLLLNDHGLFQHVLDFTFDIYIKFLGQKTIMDNIYFCSFSPTLFFLSGLIPKSGMFVF